MLRIGLTGGIASGKSEVAAVLRRLGAKVVSADLVYDELVRPGSPVLGAIAAEFGPDVLTEEGALDRRRLSAIVFGDPKKLARLTAVTGPPLVAAIMERTEEIEREDPDGVVVVDAAILLEWDILDFFDLVVVVRAPRDERLGRLTHAGLSEKDALARIASQAHEESLLAAADVVVENDSSLGELGAKIENLWRSLRDRKGERV
jgi:dephospho-CoA kinase